MKQTAEARMENRLWEARVKARGQPGRWRAMVALDVGGLTVDTEGLTASMAEEGLYKVPAGVCTQDVTAAASVEVS